MLSFIRPYYELLCLVLLRITDVKHRKCSSVEALQASSYRSDTMLNVQLGQIFKLMIEISKLVLYSINSILEGSPIRNQKTISEWQIKMIIKWACPLNIVMACEPLQIHVFTQVGELERSSSFNGGIPQIYYACEHALVWRFVTLFLFLICPLPVYLINDFFTFKSNGMYN